MLVDAGVGLMAMLGSVWAVGRLLKHVQYSSVKIVHVPCAELALV